MQFDGHIYFHKKGLCQNLLSSTYTLPRGSTTAANAAVTGPLLLVGLALAS